MPDNPEMEFSRQITKLDGFLQDTCTGNTKEETKNLVSTYRASELDEYKKIICKIKATDPKKVPMSDSTAKDLAFFLEAVSWEIPDTTQPTPGSIQSLPVPTDSVHNEPVDFTESEYLGLETFLEQVCAGRNEKEIRQLISVQFLQDISFFHQMISQLILPSNEMRKKKLPETTIKQMNTLLAINDWHLVTKESVSKDKPEMALSKDVALNDEDITTLSQFMSKTMGNRLPTTTQMLIKNWDRKEIKNIRRIVAKIIYDDPSSLPTTCNAEIIKRSTKLIETARWRIKDANNEEPRKRPQTDKSETSTDPKRLRAPSKSHTSSADKTSPANDNAEDGIDNEGDSIVIGDTEINNSESFSIKDLSFQTQPSNEQETSSHEMSSTLTSDQNTSMAVANYSTRENKIYCIKKPLNTRKQWEPNPNSHIVKWISTQPAGFGVYISGPDYVKDCVNDILLYTKKTFGEFKRFHQDDKYTLLVMTTKQGRDVILDIINNDVKGLTAEIATHRYPQIKISVHQSKLTDPKEMVKKIHMFNFKDFQKHKFELCGTHRTRNSPFTTLIIQIDPQIRNYITTKKNGKIWLDRYYDVVDHFAVKRCFTCGRLGHFKCRRTQPVCTRCGLHHQRKLCKTEKPKCTTCSGDHEAFTLDCDMFRQAIDNEMDKIDYDYSDIMLGRCF